MCIFADIIASCLVTLGIGVEQGKCRYDPHWTYQMRLDQMNTNQEMKMNRSFSMSQVQTIRS